MSFLPILILLCFIPPHLSYIRGVRRQQTRLRLYAFTRKAPTIRREESKISGEKIGRFLVWLNIFIKFASAIFIDT